MRHTSLDCTVDRTLRERMGGGGEARDDTATVLP
jgi:hypothetical protein